MHTRQPPTAAVLWAEPVSMRMPLPGNWRRVARPPSDFIFCLLNP